jgi:hypothetical protein
MEDFDGGCGAGSGKDSKDVFKVYVKQILKLFYGHIET